MFFQCSWCGTFFLNDITLSGPSPLNTKMSHGICCKCKIDMERSYFSEKEIGNNSISTTRVAVLS